MIKKNPVLAYYILTFLISWGGFLLIGGSGLLTGTNWQTDPRFQFAVLAMLAGPPFAGLLLSFIVSGKAGLRELFARSIRWRVSGRWYAFAILTAPLIQLAVLIALSNFSSLFLPSIFVISDKAALLVAGIAVGLVGGLVEELGWTGFAIPRLRSRYSLLTTGIIVGIFWGMWHLLQMWWVSMTSAEAIPLAIFVPLYFISSILALTAFRVLMVRVYDRTNSLLVAILMHASYIFSTLFVLAPPIKGPAFLIYNFVFTFVLWAVVAAVALADQKQIA
ncbi:MAG: CPBP family intramembrane metalloprotease [Candidatus Margulisbacteria bacterium]|nr:CPBP family intramembrane metalloprotease [Candidatus Margulisiibacteriota bacterium]